MKIQRLGGLSDFVKMRNKANALKAKGKPYRHLKRASELMAKQIDNSIKGARK